MLTLLGRETFLVKIEWNDDWPIFNDGKNITLETAGRDLVKSVSKPGLLMWKADLSKDALELGWYQKSIFIPYMNYTPLTCNRYSHQAVLQPDRTTRCAETLRQLL